MKQYSVLDEILFEFGIDSENPNTGDIPRERIRKWMKETDIETLGALNYLLSNRRYYSRIKPPVNRRELSKFLLHYHERCFHENPDGEWSESRYDTGRDLFNWFVQLWKNGDIYRSELLRIKKLLARLYKDGDEGLRTCVVTATLEHLFEYSDIKDFFADWKDHKVLQLAYHAALEFGIRKNERGGV